MYRDHAARAEFLSVYIREAHAADEWQMTSNEDEGVCYAQPLTLEQRRAVARDFAKRFAWPLPLVIDPMADPADAIYAGWPERIYILDGDGKIAYKGKPGPFGFHPEEAEEWLAKLD